MQQHVFGAARSAVAVAFLAPGLLAQLPQPIGQTVASAESLGLTEESPISTTRVVVRFRDPIPATQVRVAFATVGVAHVRRGYGDAYDVLEVPEGQAEAWAAWLRQQDAVVYAEPEVLVQKTGTPPNDPFFGFQWHLADRGVGGSNYGIQAPEAWTRSTGAGAVVAIVDTGVAYENYGGYVQAPDLAQTSFVAGYDFVNGDTHANDDEGHGTHVCGTVAQSTNNGLGVAGVAYDATVMPVKVLDASGSGATSWVADGIRFAADNGAHVINLSLGSSVGATVLQDAVVYAAARGVVICAATGNSGATSIGYPARYDQCIAVGATRFDGQRAYYSQRGTGIDVSAPGGDVTVDQNGDGYGDGVLQMTFSGGVTSFGYSFFQGTSMATPHVAGVAALLKAARPSATAAEIRTAIESTCVDLGSSGYDTTYGFGLIDAPAAIDALLGVAPPPPPPPGPDTTPPAAPSNLTSSRAPGVISLNWADNSEPDLAFYRVYRGTSSNPNNSSLYATTTASAFADTSVVRRVRYYYWVSAVDTAGNESARSNSTSQRAR
jgi:serine protease